MIQFGCAAIAGFSTQEDTMKHDNVTELHRLASPFKFLDCGTSLCAMDHFEQYCKNHLTGNGLGITTLNNWINLRTNTRRWIGSTGVQGELGAPVWRRS